MPATWTPLGGRDLLVAHRQAPAAGSHRMPFGIKSGNSSRKLYVHVRDAVFRIEAPLTLLEPFQYGLGLCASP